MSFSLSNFASCTILALAGLASSASATVLTFDYSPDGDGITVPSSYGDFVTNFNSGGFKYGSGGGLTPHVQTFYGSASDQYVSGGQKLSATQYYTPSNVFGDLAEGKINDGVLHQGIKNGAGNLLQIRLIAEPGYDVCLTSFDLAASYNIDPLIAHEPLTVQSIKIKDAFGGAVLASKTLEEISETGHNHYDWNIVAHGIIIEVDLSFYHGAKLNRIGIDNVEFKEIGIPAPSAAMLLGASGMLAARRRRR